MHPYRRKKWAPGLSPRILSIRVQIVDHQNELVGSRGRVVAIGDVCDDDDDMKMDFSMENDDIQVIVCLTPGEHFSEKMCVYLRVCCIARAN
jgi:hypothetical protein